MLAARDQGRMEWEAMIGKRCRCKLHYASPEEEPLER